MLRPGIPPGPQQEKTMVRKPTRVTKSRKARSTTKRADSETKQDAVLKLLRRAQGASVDEIIEITEWQPNSVRGFFSGALKKRLGLDVVSNKDAKTGVRRYHVAALKA